VDKLTFPCGSISLCTLSEVVATSSSATGNRTYETMAVERRGNSLDHAARSIVGVEHDGKRGVTRKELVWEL
jgi:hypothetical protein